MCNSRLSVNYSKVFRVQGLLIVDLRLLIVDLRLLIVDLRLLIADHFSSLHADCLTRCVKQFRLGIAINRRLECVPLSAGFSVLDEATAEIPALLS